MENYIRREIQESIRIKEQIMKSDEMVYSIAEISKLILECINNGNKVIFAGNGGSASDAEHLACELVNRFKFHRPGLPAMALSANTAVLTAISNDYGYDNVFAQQVLALGREGDVFIGITTSGKSKNIIEAFKKARDRGVINVCFTGENASKLRKYSDLVLQVPSIDTCRIQEAHITIGHIICAIIEEVKFGGKSINK